MSALSARQRELVAASAAAASRTRRGIDSAAGLPPAPGDVFVLAATSELPVEWLLLEQQDPSGPFLAVPGDSHPFVGSEDLEIETTAGRLFLRCRARTELSPERLDPGRRVATVEPGELERAREKVRELSGEPLSAGSLLEEIDTSPDYRQWLREVVEPAQARATGNAGALLPFPVPTPVRRRSRQTLYAAAAAAIFFLVAAGLGTWALREQRRADRLAAQGREAREALSAARLGREEASRSLEELRRRQQAEVGELRQRIAALEKTETAPPAPLLNLPVAILLPEETMRGEEEPLRLPAGSPFLVVVLRFRETPGMESYGVTLASLEGERPIWSGDGLTRSAQGTVQLALPRRLVPPGRYRLHLTGLRRGKPTALARFTLEVAP